MNQNQCFKSETDIFSQVPIQTSIDDGSWDAIAPLNNFETGTMEFDVTPTDEYIDLSETQLYLKCSIRKKTNDLTSAILKSTDKAGPINNFLHSLFDQVILSLNNTPVENSNGSYAYRAYIENLLNFNESAKSTHLQACLFYKDTSGYMDSIDQVKPDKFFKVTSLDVANNKITGTENTESTSKDHNQNRGFNIRKNIFVDRKSVEMVGPLHIDMFNTNRYLLNRVPLKLTLHRSKNDFCLMGDSTDYFTYIEKAFLYIRKVKLSSNIVEQHIKQLQSLNAIYPIRRVVVKQHTIYDRTMSETIDKICTGKMPRRVVVGFVNHSASTGNMKFNPFNFQNFNIESINLLVGGFAVPYRQPLTMNFAESQYIRGYDSVFKGLNRAVYESGNDISYSDYSKGYTLFAFNLTPDLCDGEHYSLPKTGDLRIDVKFKDELVTNITAIIYLEFDSVVQVTNHRQILFDYKV